jgi:catechol 2,3-dioxygenase-like lactoylglutathione lyase family enzyme
VLRVAEGGFRAPGSSEPFSRTVLLCDAAEVLASALTVAFVPSTDLDRSRRFYEEVLGLSVAQQDPFAIVLDTGRVTIRVTNVGHEFNVQPFTVLGWEVDDIEAGVASLVERGVVFLRVGTMEQDEAGVWAAPDGSRIAWFKDPDGNTLSLSQQTHRIAAATQPELLDR